MANINDLNLLDEEAPEQDLSQLPEPPSGSFGVFLQPGRYAFRIPPGVTEVWGVDSTERGQRAFATFEGANSLQVEPDGKPFRAKVHSRERSYNDVLVSDMMYLFQALGEKTYNPNPKSVIETLNKHKGETFKADVTLQANCSEGRPVYELDSTGNSVKNEAKFGCGKEYQQQGFTRKKGKKAGQTVLVIPKEDGQFVERFQCSCGAVLRSFQQLQNFGPAK